MFATAKVGSGEAGDRNPDDNSGTHMSGRIPTPLGFKADSRGVQWCKAGDMSQRQASHPDTTIWNANVSTVRLKACSSTYIFLIIAPM